MSLLFVEKVGNMKKSVSVIVGTALVVIVLFVGYRQTSEVRARVITAESGEIVHTVSETGRLINETDFDLSYKVPGAIERVYVQIGEIVKTGDPLVLLDQEELRIQLRQAEARQLSRQAELDQILSGETQERVAVYAAARNNAKTILLGKESAEADARVQLIDSIQNAYVVSDDAIRNRADQLFQNPRSANPELLFITASQQLKEESERDRIFVGTVLQEWSAALDNFSNVNEVEAFGIEAKAHLNHTKVFLDRVSFVVNELSESSSFSQATIDTWRAQVAVGRTNVSNAIIALAVAQEKFNAAVSGLQVAKGELQSREAEYAAIVADPRAIDVARYEGRVRDAKGTVALLEKQIADTVLRAPSDGVVTQIYIEKGEQILPNQFVVSLSSSARQELEVYIAEEEIVQISQDNSIMFTLDAFPGDQIFSGIVRLIEPSATVIENEVYYKIQGEILSDIEGARDGMTADIDIIVHKKTNVLRVPTTAIYRDSEGTYVEVFNGILRGKERRAAEIGISGNGFIEIVKGLVEGEHILDQAS